MNVTCISDTHSRHEALSLAPGDVLIHAGDLTSLGSVQDILAVYAWLERQPFKHIIVVPGNHDSAFEQMRYLPSALKGEFPKITTLINQVTQIGKYLIYGSPYTPYFFDWAFNFSPGGKGLRDAERMWESIPNETNILITHGPAYGMRDVNNRKEFCGDSALKARIEKLQNLRLHVFGHIHPSYGVTVEGARTFVNAAICDDLLDPINQPIRVDLSAFPVTNGE
ncbi:MAG: metallophosphatase domain-containing protein [Vulcanimicrobiaceae bacterium]